MHLLISFALCCLAMRGSVADEKRRETLIEIAKKHAEEQHLPVIKAALDVEPNELNKTVEPHSLQTAAPVLQVLVPTTTTPSDKQGNTTSHGLGCSNLPCQNGGTCNVEERGDYSCSCTSDYYGRNCQFSVADIQNNTSNSRDAIDAKRADETHSELHPVASKPINPFFPIEKPRQCYKPPHTCCDLRKTVVNLHRKIPGIINNLSPSVEVLSPPIQMYSQPECGHMALLKVRFDKTTPKYCPFCHNYPGCGRRMLKIDLELHKKIVERASGFRRMFNFGDSSTNNGWGGDSGTQQNDAELDGKDDFLYMYPNDRCERKVPFIFENALAANVTRLSVYIANDFVRITNDQGCDKEMCSGCFFALNGQPDSSPGGQNEEIFVALNRVVRGDFSRRGYGVCRATLSWVCPWPIDCPYQPCSIKDGSY